MTNKTYRTQYRAQADRIAYALRNEGIEYVLDGCDLAVRIRTVREQMVLADEVLHVRAVYGDAAVVRS